MDWIKKNWIWIALILAGVAIAYFTLPGEKDGSLEKARAEKERLRQERIKNQVVEDIAHEDVIPPEDGKT